MEQFVFGQRAGRDDAGDGAFDHAGGVRRVLHLVRDGDAIARIEEGFDVRFGIVDGNPGHRVRSGVILALCERDFEDSGALLGRFAERLVEVADLKQYHRIVVPATQFEVLAHHRRQLVAVFGHLLGCPQRRVHARNPVPARQ